MSGTCNDCKHWSPTGEAAAAGGGFCYRSSSVYQAGLPGFSEDDGLEKRKFAAVGGSLLVTAADFGCNQFEAKD